jgi:hypothetical protein
MQKNITEQFAVAAKDSKQFLLEVRGRARKCIAGNSTTSGRVRAGLEC